MPPPFSSGRSGFDVIDDDKHTGGGMIRLASIKAFQKTTTGNDNIVSFRGRNASKEVVALAA